MNSIADWDEDGLFDGALLFDGRDYRSRENIVWSAHAGNRLGLVRDRGSYFRAEFLHKVPAYNSSVPVWDDARSSAICGSVIEGKTMIEQFLVGEPRAGAA